MPLPTLNMSSTLRIPILLLVVAAFVVDGRVTAQVDRVNVMPGYPNAPRTDPGERRPVRPTATLILWGSANDGDGTANGYTYTWSVTPSPDFMIVDDGSLTGQIQDDSYITEEVSFSLLNGVTKALASATLSVTDGVMTKQDTVEIAIMKSKQNNIIINL